MKAPTHPHHSFLPPRIPSQEEVTYIRDTANHNLHWCVVRDVIDVVYATGVRRRELQHLRKADIDAKRNRLHIVVTRSSGNGRFVPLHPDTLAAIERLQSLSPCSEFVLGDNAHLRLMRASRDFRKICSQIGLNNGSLHMLRNAFAVRLAYVGMDSNHLRYVMGYRDLRANVLQQDLLYKACEMTMRHHFRPQNEVGN
jgi:integrase